MSKEKTKRVACCLITNIQDDILMGKRTDNNLWTVPGGHLDRGEDPYEGAIRELKEETGLDCQDIKLVKVKKNGNILVYVFKCTVDCEQEIDVSGDPDGEFTSLEYIDPNEVCDNLHVPIDNNYVMHYWMDN